MNTSSKDAQESEHDRTLSIGDLADRTGLSAATLRVWETRHGFPRPQRLAGGHRRYGEADVRVVRRVVARREAGVRLDVAIAEAVAAARPDTPSVFAELRRRHPHLPVQRLRKATLLALSWAIEDEFCAKASHAHLFGSFQREAHYEPAAARWSELARVSHAAFVFADFPSGVGEVGSGPLRVPLGPDAPMAREWAVVCDSVELPVALTAWEVPGQSVTADRDRVFEALWTVEPAAVRDAARVCAGVAAGVHPEAAAPLLYELAENAPTSGTDLAAVSTMFNRIVAYVDRFGR